MKNILVTLLLLFGIAGVCCTQNMVGKHKDEIKTIIKENLPDFKLDNSTVNPIYKYLKYVDSVNEQTLLIFLDKNDRCTFSKLMSDYSNFDVTIQQLNKKYKKVKQNEWIYIENKIKYSVTLTEDEWYFTVVTKKSNK